MSHVSFAGPRCTGWPAEADDGHLASCKSCQSRLMETAVLAAMTAHLDFPGFGKAAKNPRTKNKPATHHLYSLLTVQIFLNPPNNNVKTDHI